MGSGIKLTLQNVIDRAIQAHGGAGVSNDFPLAGAWIYARTIRIADGNLMLICLSHIAGPDEVHLQSIAKMELEKYSNVDSRITKASQNLAAVVSVASPQDMLEIYALGKQATTGDNTGKGRVMENLPLEPMPLSDAKARMKWETWNSLKGMSKEDAISAYVKKIEQLKAKKAKL